MSQLLVALPTGPAAEWAYALAAADGRTIASHGSAPPGALPVPRGAGAEVVAVVPVQALAWHRVTLPAGAAAGSPRLRAALEGLLEEELLDEPEALHFAVQPAARAGDGAWVAVCDRRWLREALQQLEAGGRPAARIVPELAPGGGPALHVLGEAEQALVVATTAEGLVGVPLTAATLPLLPALPPDAPRLAEPAVAAQAEQLLQAPVELQQAPQRWLQAAQGGWDLAQFDLASSPRTRALRRLGSGWSELAAGPRWRAVRWGVGVLVAAHLVGVNAYAWKERGALAAKREAVRATLAETFPHVRVILDAPVQMEREVATLRQLAGVASPRDLEAQLAALAAALPAGRHPAALQYGSGELRASGLALTPEETGGVAGTLRSLGYAARVEGDALVLVAEDVR